MKNDVQSTYDLFTGTLVREPICYDWLWLLGITSCLLELSRLLPPFYDDSLGLYPVLPPPCLCFTKC